MSEIKGFDLSRLTQDENFGFHSFAIVEFEKCKDSKITEFVNNYKVKYNVFDGSMKVSGGENVLSYDVTRLDKVRDDAYRGLKRQNNVAMNDFDPVIAEIARQIDIILRRNGDPCSLPYLAENSAVINLIQDLEEFDNHSEEEERPGELSDPTNSPLDGYHRHRRDQSGPPGNRCRLPRCRQTPQRAGRSERRDGLSGDHQ